MLESLPSGPERIDVLWSVFRGDTSTPWFELATAARTEPELHERMSEVAVAMGDRIHDVWAELFPPPPGYRPTPCFFDGAPLFLCTVLGGLAMRHLTHTQAIDGEADIVLSVVRFLARENPLYEKEDAT
jgi:hypothetical protein